MSDISSSSKPRVGSLNSSLLGFAGASMGAAMIAGSLFIMYFRSEVASYLRGGRTDNQFSVDARSAAKRPIPSSGVAISGDENLSTSKSSDAVTMELELSLAQERARSASLERETKDIRREAIAQSVRIAETNDEVMKLREIARNTTALQQMIIQERARSSALENELEIARREIQQAAVTRKNQGRRVRKRPDR